MSIAKIAKRLFLTSITVSFHKITETKLQLWTTYFDKLNRITQKLQVFKNSDYQNLTLDTYSVLQIQTVIMRLGTRLPFEQFRCFDFNS